MSVPLYSGNCFSSGEYEKRITEVQMAAKMYVTQAACAQTNSLRYES